MSTVTSSKSGKGKKEDNSPQILQNERLKIVVRRLPPNLPEDIFWQSVLPWVTEDTTTWKIFYPGKLRKRLNKESVPSRAYIAFKSEEQLALFSHHYDGHTFRDKNAVESHAVVEFAPHPKIPGDKKKPDGRNGTIEKDEDYISFIESLKAAENVEPVSIEVLVASAQPAPPPKTTPLLEALKAEKTAAKDKEILRNHNAARKPTSVPLSAPVVKRTPDAQISNSSSMASKKSKNVTQTQVIPDTQSSGGSIKGTPRSALPSARTPSQAESSRRMRPVIPSRQFEAALSVAGLASFASERKKREKEKEVTSVSTTDNSPSDSTSKKEGSMTTLGNRSAHASDVLGKEIDNSGVPSSPKRDRSKRVRPGGHAGTKSSETTNASGVPIKTPSILQRSDTAPTPGPATVGQTSSHTDSALTESPTKSNVHLPRDPISNGGTASPHRGRGGRRGRGFGGRGIGRGSTRGGPAITTSPRESG